MAQNSRPKPVVLIVMDGVGVAPPSPGNAVTLANTVNLDKYWPKYPHTYLEASGVHVGLPSGVDGNSEVGHVAIGAGKIIFQDLPRIDNAIEVDNSFYENPELKAAFAHARKNGGAVHILGLVGTGKVHASRDHLHALIEMGVKEKVDPDKFFIHAITDGRDSDPDIAADVIQEINNVCLTKRMGRVVSMMGRYFAMDRDKRWNRTQMAYDLLTKGKGHITKDVNKAVEDFYKRGVTDEFLEPTVILLNEQDKPKIVKPGDAVIFFNFRPDRAIQISEAFDREDFDGFPKEPLENVYFVGMTQYKEGMPKHVAFPPEKVENYLSKVLSVNKLRQLHVAESEKFAHITYFFNAGSRTAQPGEDWIEVPSPKDVATYDQKPEMSQKWVADVVVQKINADQYDFVMVNFAGPDMVAHTGVIDATIESMQVCDECIGRIVDAALAKGGAAVITADHGNAEEMINLTTGEPDTKHSINQVPVIVIQEGLVPRELTVGNLSDVAPTILSIMGIEKPAEMTGRDLLT